MPLIKVTQVVPRWGGQGPYRGEALINTDAITCAHPTLHRGDEALLFVKFMDGATMTIVGTLETLLTAATVKPPKGGTGAIRPKDL